MTCVSQLPDFKVSCFALAGSVYPESILFSIGCRVVGLVIGYAENYHELLLYHTRDIIQ